MLHDGYANGGRTRLRRLEWANEGKSAFFIQIFVLIVRINFHSLFLSIKLVFYRLTIIHFLFLDSMVKLLFQLLDQIVFIYFLTPKVTNRQQLNFHSLSRSQNLSSLSSSSSPSTFPTNTKRSLGRWTPTRNLDRCQNWRKREMNFSRPESWKRPLKNTQTPSAD